MVTMTPMDTNIVTPHTIPPLDTAGLRRVLEADRALRALEALLEWRDNAPGYGHGTMGVLRRVNRWEVYIQRSGSKLFTGEGQPALPAAILAAHAALVAAGELPPLGEDNP